MGQRTHVKRRGDYPLTGGRSDPLSRDSRPQVTLNLDGGTTLTVPVHENVYMTNIHGGLASVTYQGPNGPVTLDN